MSLQHGNKGLEKSNQHENNYCMDFLARQTLVVCAKAKKIGIDSAGFGKLQWNLSVTTTSIIKFITCDLPSNVF